MKSIEDRFLDLRELLIETRGDERSEHARYLSIVLTLLDQAFAVYKTFVDDET